MSALSSLPVYSFAALLKAHPNAMLVATKKIAAAAATGNPTGSRHITNM